VAQKFHFTFMRIEVTRASRGLSAIAELLVVTTYQSTDMLLSYRLDLATYRLTDTKIGPYK